MKLWLLLLALLFFSPAAGRTQTPDRFLGVLELPPLCWWECERRGRPLPLYPAPALTEPALILRHDMLYLDPQHQNRDSPYWPETEEFEYENSGAIVYEKRGDWFRIRIGSADFWVAAQDAAMFHPYPQLLREKLTYLADWNFVLWENPGESPVPLDHPFKDNPALADRIPVSVQDTLNVDGQWWVQVKIFEQSPCAEDMTPFLAEGWVPAYTAANRRSLWFYPRGC